MGFTPKASLDLRVNLTCRPLGCGWSTRREPIQANGEHANFTQKCFRQPVYSNTCCEATVLNAVLLCLENESPTRRSTIKTIILLSNLSRKIFVAGLCIWQAKYENYKNKFQHILQIMAATCFLCTSENRRCTSINKSLKSLFMGSVICHLWWDLQKRETEIPLWLHQESAKSNMWRYPLLLSLMNKETGESSFLNFNLILNFEIVRLQICNLCQQPWWEPAFIQHVDYGFVVFPESQSVCVIL